MPTPPPPSLTIPQDLFVVALWAALAAVATAALYLLVVLVREWRRGELW